MQHAKVSLSMVPGRLGVRHGRSRRSGFSMLELAVVMGVTLLLMAIAVMGYRSLQASAANKRTRMVLHNAQAMLAELDRTGGTIAIVIPPTSPVPIPLPYMTTSTIASPGDVTSEPNRTNVIQATSPVLAILKRDPANQQAFSQLPPDSSVSVIVANVQYAALADGYNNPIIFVPPGGMTGVGIGAGVRTNPVIITNPITIKSPDGRSFFASAGPDGNFTLGDDNIYSFDK